MIMVLSNSGSPRDAALFVYDCNSGAVRRQSVRDVPPQGSVTGAVYDAFHSRVVLGVASGSSKEVSTLDVYNHAGRVARLPTGKTALTPSAFATTSHRVACMEISNNSSSSSGSKSASRHTGVVHVYELGKPGDESSSQLLCRLRVEHNQLRRLLFTPAGDYLLTLYGDAPTDAGTTFIKRHFFVIQFLFLVACF